MEGNAVVEMAWHRYVIACDDVTIPMSTIARLKEIYERTLKECTR